MFIIVIGKNHGMFTSSVGATGALYLNSTGDVDTGAYYWNDTAPTTQQFQQRQQCRELILLIMGFIASQDGISKIGRSVAQVATSTLTAVLPRAHGS